MKLEPQLFRAFSLQEDEKREYPQIPANSMSLNRCGEHIHADSKVYVTKSNRLKT
jgi:hypothetical protein